MKIGKAKDYPQSMASLLIALYPNNSKNALNQAFWYPEWNISLDLLNGI